MRKPTHLLLSAAIGLGLAVAASLAGAKTLELKVEGLNCALCSDAMKAGLLKATEARAVEPRLECGRILLDTDMPATKAEAALSWVLTSNGFNLKSVSELPVPFDVAKASKC